LAKAEAANGGSKRKPKLGQNFLTDPGATKQIVDALGDISQSTVVEIGPGRGALTRALALRAGHLIAVELDRVLAAQLRMQYSTLGTVEIIEADVLTVDFPTMLGIRTGPLRDLRPTARSKAKVVGNLPYYITSDILLRLFSFHEVISTMVVMVQLEVADRIAAKPGSSDYGLLSATAQLYKRVEKLSTLPPTAFTPPPKVHSAVLRLTVEPKLPQLEVEESGFIEFLKLSFGQKRKTLVNNLRARYEPEQIKRAMKTANVKPDARSEAISLEKMAALFKALSATLPT
jgi:16S rRNA (adenine1518-N6/adenine1519-N6)-dimethyltransferase